MILFNKQTPKSFLLFIVLLILFSLYGQPVHSTSASTQAATILVDINTGGDGSGCGTENQPCASIQYAVNKAATSGNIIRVAAGTYTFNAAADTCSSVIGTTAVVCIRNKELTILGGYTASNWTTPNPATNITIIDGQNSQRGILVQHGSGQPPATLHMEGFTVQNCRVQGASSGDDSKTFAFGGGMRADFSTTILKHMIFKNNLAIGGNTSANYGGAGSGGGIALRSGLSGSSLEHITFENNQAIGGSGLNRGGFGIGGGLYTFKTIVSGSHITLTNNLSRGGNSTGSGYGSSGNNADAQGGGAAFHLNSSVTLNHLAVSNNQSIGGNAPNGQGGGSFGGGIFAEQSDSINLSQAIVYNNLSLGGNGKNSESGGSVSFGGGIATYHTPFTLDRSIVFNNVSTGGNGTQKSGSGNGGGASFTRTKGDSTIYISNSIFVNNLAEMGNGSVSGGGGGGIYLRGTEATIIHTTIAQNAIGSSMYGNGLLLLNDAAPTASVANISYSIIADHASTMALYVKPGNTVNLNKVLFNGNNIDNGGGGTINGQGTNLTGSPDFVSPGAPNYNYQIKNTSAARDNAVGSSTTVDINGDARDTNPDVGADEYIPPSITTVLGVPNASTAVLIIWEVSHMDDSLDHYEIIITCSGGGHAPNEVACNVAHDVGTPQQFQLTGLTNFVTYSVEVSAYDDEDTLLNSNSTSFIPTDIFVYLPVILKN